MKQIDFSHLQTRFDAPPRTDLPERVRVLGEQNGQADRPLVYSDGKAGGEMAAGEDQAAVYRGDEALP